MINAYILIKPVMTEKSLGLAKGQNIYTFKVVPSATKSQIAQVIKDVYDVDVLKVRTIMSSASMRKTGRKRLKVSVAKTKRALVTLKEGQTIELFDLGK